MIVAGSLLHDSCLCIIGDVTLDVAKPLFGYKGAGCRDILFRNRGHMALDVATSLFHN